MNLVVVGFHFGLIGGLEIVSKAIAAAAAERHDVTCLALHETGVVEQPDYRVVGLASPNWVVRSLRFRLPRFFPSSLGMHLANADAVIFAHAGTLRAALPLLARKSHRPYVVCWLHGREVWGDCGRDLAPLLQQCDRLVSVSHYTADVVTEMMPGRSRPDVIHNPVDTDTFRPVDEAAGEEVQRNTILYVGRHDADSVHKGCDVLIDAMALLRDQRPHRKLHLTVTGSGPLLQRHKDQIRRLSLEDRVFLAGRVSRAELVRLYRTTDIFAFPSRIVSHQGEMYGEGFGLVNIEAASCGRPVITSTHGGCPETVIDGVTGFAVDPTAPQSVASSIERLFDMSPDARDQMGRQGREMALSRFSSFHFRQRFDDLISSVWQSRVSSVRVPRAPMS